MRIARVCLRTTGPNSLRVLRSEQVEPKQQAPVPESGGLLFSDKRRPVSGPLMFAYGPPISRVEG